MLQVIQVMIKTLIVDTVIFKKNSYPRLLGT